MSFTFWIEQKLISSMILRWTCIQGVPQNVLAPKLDIAYILGRDFGVSCHSPMSYISNITFMEI